jgi:hypothetical protein
VIGASGSVKEALTHAFYCCWGCRGGKGGHLTTPVPGVASCSRYMHCWDWGYSLRRGTNMHATSSPKTSFRSMCRVFLCVFCCTPQGRLGAALRYLEMVPGEASTSVAVLKDRIYRWGGGEHLDSLKLFSS